MVSLFLAYGMLPQPPATSGQSLTFNPIYSDFSNPITIGKGLNPSTYVVRRKTGVDLLEIKDGQPVFTQISPDTKLYPALISKGGMCILTNGERIFAWSIDQALRELTGLIGGPVAMNDHGDVLTSTGGATGDGPAYIFSNGKVEKIPIPEGYNRMYPLGIDNQGNVLVSIFLSKAEKESVRGGVFLYDTNRTFWPYESSYYGIYRYKPDGTVLAGKVSQESGSGVLVSAMGEDAKEFVPSGTNKFGQPLGWQLYEVRENLALGYRIDATAHMDKKTSQQVVAWTDPREVVELESLVKDFPANADIFYVIEWFDTGEIAVIYIQDGKHGFAILS